MATTEHRLNEMKKKWGDQDELDDYNEFQEITTEAEPEADGSIRKTVVEYKTNENGQSVKIVKRVRAYKTKVKINKRVEERKKWRKFGECAGAPRGPEPGITSVGDEVFLDLFSADDSSEGKVKKHDVVNLGIICRKCGKTGEHWTHQCPYFKTGGPTLVDDVPRRPEGATATTDANGKYVPPSMRKGGPTGESDRGGERGRRDESATIRVTNLSEDTKESDLSDLFRTFGPISRIYLAKDKITGLSKGFAFINFMYREDAGKAIERLSGKFGYDHLILHLEWAKPSNK